MTLEIHSLMNFLFSFSVRIKFLLVFLLYLCLFSFVDLSVIPLSVKWNIFDILGRLNLYMF